MRSSDLITSFVCTHPDTSWRAAFPSTEVFKLTLSLLISSVLNLSFRFLCCRALRKIAENLVQAKLLLTLRNRLAMRTTFVVFEQWCWLKDAWSLLIDFYFLSSFVLYCFYGKANTTGSLRHPWRYCETTNWKEIDTTCSALLPTFLNMTNEKNEQVLTSINCSGSTKSRSYYGANHRPLLPLHCPIMQENRDRTTRALTGKLIWQSA